MAVRWYLRFGLSYRESRSCPPHSPPVGNRTSPGAAAAGTGSRPPHTTNHAARHRQCPPGQRDLRSATRLGRIARPNRQGLLRCCRRISDAKCRADGQRAPGAGPRSRSAGLAGGSSRRVGRHFAPAAGRPSDDGWWRHGGVDAALLGSAAAAGRADRHLLLPQPTCPWRRPSHLHAVPDWVGRLMPSPAHPQAGTDHLTAA
jgi:hypothetical protein